MPRLQSLSSLLPVIQGMSICLDLTKAGGLQGAGNRPCLESISIVIAEFKTQTLFREWKQWLCNPLWITCLQCPSFFVFSYVHKHICIYMWCTPESCHEGGVGHNSFRGGEMEEMMAPSFGRWCSRQQSHGCLNRLQHSPSALVHKRNQKPWRLGAGKVQ